MLIFLRVLIILLVACKVVLCQDANDDILIYNSHQSENSISIHPECTDVLINANIQDPGNAQSRIRINISSNSGLSWSSYQNTYNNSADPSVKINQAGQYFISYLSYGNQYIDYSLDGINWVNSFTYPNTDKNHLWIDNSIASPYNGTVYNSWTDRSGNANQIIIYKSSNGLGGWINLNFPTYDYAKKLGVNLKTDSDGRLLVVWAEIININYIIGIKFAYTENSGSTWNGPYSIPTLGMNVEILKAGFPVLGINQYTNQPIVVWCENGNDGLDIFYSTATFSKGYNWNNPEIVNQSYTRDQFKPWVACDPYSDILACIYYDERESLNRINTYVSYSTNFGINWIDIKVSDVDHSKFFPTGPGNDYIGIDILKGKIYPVWSDNRDGTFKAYISPFTLNNHDLSLNNQTISFNKNYFAINSIITGPNLTILQPYKVNLEAGNFLDLKEGTFFEENSLVNAKILNCYSNSLEDGITIDSDLLHFLQNEKLNTIIPEVNNLYQNYPNPFNPNTLIVYTLKKDSYVKLIIYDVLGKVVKILTDQNESKGLHFKKWDGKNDFGINVNSGLYLCKIVINDYSSTKKMVLIK